MFHINKEIKNFLNSNNIKHIDGDKNKTESQIMFERGYGRICDCGSMKFELKLK